MTARREYPLVAVVAMARNRVIGDGEKLLWHLPGDLARVKALTMGRPLIMGRRTFESIGRPLPGRASIVMTRNADFRPDGAMVAGDADDALAMAAEWIAGGEGRTGEDRVGEIVVFGGGEIYREFLGRTDRIEMTEVDAAPDIDGGGATFPELDGAEWRETGREEIGPAGDAPGHIYVRLERVRA